MFRGATGTKYRPIPGIHRYLARSIGLGRLVPNRYLIQHQSPARLAWLRATFRSRYLLDRYVRLAGQTGRRSILNPCPSYTHWFPI